MKQNFLIRCFEADDFNEVVNLYQKVSAVYPKTVYWWPGKDCNNWHNVYCAFINNQLVAKAQIEIVNTINSKSSSHNKHKIYINIKIDPAYETQIQILNELYARLLEKAYELKNTLPSKFGTILCVGNHESEVENNKYFICNRNYNHLKDIYSMSGMIKEDIIIPDIELDYETTFTILNESEIENYLNTESFIWTDAPLDLETLWEYKSYPLFQAIQIHKDGTLVGSVMVWVDESDKQGVIEDIFICPQWRKKGLAKYLMTNALQYLKENEVDSAKLTVVTNNTAALQLYNLFGFEVYDKEVRYYTDLN